MQEARLVATVVLTPVVVVVIIFFVIGIVTLILRRKNRPSIENQPSIDNERALSGSSSTSLIPPEPAHPGTIDTSETVTVDIVLVPPKLVDSGLESPVCLMVHGVTHEVHINPTLEFTEGHRVEAGPQMKESNIDQHDGKSATNLRPGHTKAFKDVYDCRGTPGVLRTGEGGLSRIELGDVKRAFCHVGIDPNMQDNLRGVGELISLKNDMWMPELGKILRCSDLASNP